jgi:hypothetical protein
MAAIESLTAPLVVRFANGTKHLVAAAFPHPRGMIYLDLYWHRRTPERAAHLIEGELRGEGPWRVGDAVVRVLGCQATDPELQETFAEWQHYLQTHEGEYPPRAQIRDIARRLGACIPED